jgi:tetratricopeptide (TPR) repeat protein
MRFLSLDARGHVIFLFAFLGIADLTFSLRPTSQAKHPNTSANTIEAHVGKGYEYVQNSQFQLAAQEFQAALALNPALARVRYQLAVCHFALQQFKEAREEFERLRREAGADAGVLYYLARLDLLDENLDSAISLLEGIASPPPFPDTAYYLGSAYLKKGKLEEAEKWLKKAVELGPRDFRVPDRLARVYMKAGRRQEAEKQYALSTSLRQNYNEAARQGIDCIQELTTRPLQEARVTCRKLFDPTDPDKLVTLGMIYGKQQHYAESVEAFEQAARLDPDSYEIQHNLGLSYFRLKRYVEARGPLEKAVALRPDFFGSNALLGATLYALKEDELAYEALDHAHQLSPADADTTGLLYKVLVLRAQKTFLKKEYVECLGYLQKAAQLRPDDAEIHRRLAQVYGLLGQRTQAEREDQEADRLSGVRP